MSAARARAAWLWMRRDWCVMSWRYLSAAAFAQAKREYRKGRLWVAWGWHLRQDSCSLCCKGTGIMSLPHYVIAQCQCSAKMGFTWRASALLLMKVFNKAVVQTDTDTCVPAKKAGIRRPMSTHQELLRPARDVCSSSDKQAAVPEAATQRVLLHHVHQVLRVQAAHLHLAK